MHQHTWSMLELADDGRFRSRKAHHSRECFLKRLEGFHRPRLFPFGYHGLQVLQSITKQGRHAKPGNRKGRSSPTNGSARRHENEHRIRDCII